MKRPRVTCQILCASEASAREMASEASAMERAIEAGDSEHWRLARFLFWVGWNVLCCKGNHEEASEGTQEASQEERTPSKFIRELGGGREGEDRSGLVRSREDANVHSITAQGEREVGQHWHGNQAAEGIYEDGEIDRQHGWRGRREDHDWRRGV